MTRFEEFKNLMEQRFQELLERESRVKAGDMSDCYIAEDYNLCRLRLIAEIERLQWVLEMMPSDPNEVIPED